MADRGTRECARCGGCYEGCPECGGSGVVSDTPEPRTWTLNVQSVGQACWTLICRGPWLSPIENVEVVEKAAYDAAVERAESAERILNGKANELLNAVANRVEAEAERDAAVERAETLERLLDERAGDWKAAVRYKAERDEALKRER